LYRRAFELAQSERLLHESIEGSTVIFGCDETGRHGNFHPAAYAAIRENAAWQRRLDKVHTSSRRVRVLADWQWKELDCAASSDALLMNIFCHPGTLQEAGVRALLGCNGKDVPLFGYKPKTPLRQNKRDNTEIDMKLGGLLMEAKLTESSFQVATLRMIERYEGIEEVFDMPELPQSAGRHTGYQLIRGVMAAYASGCSFCVLCDGRRSDLVEQWYQILRCVRIAELRCRLQLLTWQELSSMLPAQLQRFLDRKYGF
jgi:hypothetical protein